MLLPRGLLNANVEALADPSRKVHMVMRITSPAFGNEQPIPPRFTCDGEDVSPALSWTGVPAEAQSLALVMEDPDAPDAKAGRRTFAHWTVYNLPPDSSGLPEDVTHEQLPSGTLLGRSDFERTRWEGPCPPLGEHRYFFKLYALDCRLPIAPELTRRALLTAMDGHVLEQAELMGTYQKQNNSVRTG